MDIPKIFIALDTPNITQAKTLANQLAPLPVGLKVGLEFLHACGPEGVRKIAGHKAPLFIDCKLHDIPNTVAGAVRALTALRPFILNVHAGGGEAMLRAAHGAAHEQAAKLGITPPQIIAVTTLTSMADEDLTATGQNGPVKEQVLRLAELSRKSGLDGVVCAGSDIANIKQVCGEDFRTIVPGIRPAGSQTHDQKRTMTPAEAINAGADYLVIGRPITQADDPHMAASQILETLP